jgi:RNA polymerase Rpb3/Rpb11 dimerisation domain
MEYTGPDGTFAACFHVQWLDALQDTFIFRVESTGVLPPAEIVTTALEVLQNKLSTINGSLQTNKDAGDDPMQVG